MKGIFGWLWWASVAVAAALLMGDNPAIVTLFWPPWRVDLSFNLVVLALLAGFVLTYAAWRGVALLRELPQRARRWRALQHERATVGLVLQAQSHWLAGRYVRAQTAAREAIERLRQPQAPPPPWSGTLWVLAHLVAAESAHALGQRAQRDAWLQAALHPPHGDAAPEAREGVGLRAAEWALEAGDAAAAAQALAELPQGAARRIRAVRLRLRLAQLRRDTQGALEVARLLAKHRALSPEAAQTLLRGLWRDAVREAADAQALLAIWRGLQGAERHDPRRALAVLQRAEALGLASDGGVALPRVVDEAMRVAWSGYDQLSEDERQELVLRLEVWLARPADDGGWLGRLEQAQRRAPNDAALQYLCGQAFRSRGLWGKAQTLLQQAARGLPAGRLRRRAWVALAELAERRGDAAAALQAWQEAACTDL